MIGPGSLKRNVVEKKTSRKSDRFRLAISGLTVEQEAYCRGRAMGMSVEEALVAAGSEVNVKTAKAWERQSQRVIDRINTLAAMAQKNAILKSGLDREWVISRYMQVVERCMQAQPVLDKEGNQVGEYTFNASGANQALRALGNVLGLFKPIENNPGEEFEHLSDDDLARIAAGLAAQTGLLEIAEGTQAAPGREQAEAVSSLSKAG